MGFSTRGVVAGKSTQNVHVKASRDQNSTKRLKRENPEKSEPMLKDSNAECNKELMKDICKMEKLIKDQVVKDNWQIQEGIKTAKKSWNLEGNRRWKAIVNQALQDLKHGTVWMAEKGVKYSRSELSKVVGSICDNKDFVIKLVKGL